MKVRSLANTGANLPELYLDPRVNRKKETVFRLTLGKEYTVYAIDEEKGRVWYYVCDDNYMYYPQKHCAPLFEIVDSRVSQYWQVHLTENGLLEIAFKEWFADPYFYDKLTDQNEEEVLIWEKVKEVMDGEFDEEKPASDDEFKTLVTQGAG